MNGRSILKTEIERLKEIISDIESSYISLLSDLSRLRDRLKVEELDRKRVEAELMQLKNLINNANGTQK